LDKWYLTDVSQGIFSTTLLIECTESLFADIPTSDRMIVFCVNEPLMGMVRFRFNASTAISEQSSARISFFIRRVNCSLLGICGARCLFRSYGLLESVLKIREVLSLDKKFYSDQKITLLNTNSRPAIVKVEIAAVKEYKSLV
jgi:hypothetical protein